MEASPVEYSFGREEGLVESTACLGGGGRVTGSLLGYEEDCDICRF